jgi:hypothetical protein
MTPNELQDLKNFENCIIDIMNKNNMDIISYINLEQHAFVNSINLHPYVYREDEDVTMLYIKENVLYVECEKYYCKFSSLDISVAEDIYLEISNINDEDWDFFKENC